MVFKISSIYIYISMGKNWKGPDMKRKNYSREKGKERDFSLLQEKILTIQKYFDMLALTSTYVLDSTL